MAQLSAAEVTAWRNFLGAHASIVQRIELDLEERGLLSLEWYDVLVAILLEPNRRLRMRDIASRLLLTRSNATRLVDRLEAIGLIGRERLNEDRRGTEAVLTPAGRRALRRAWPVYARGIRRYFLETLSDDELKTVSRVMQRLSQRPRPARPALRRRTLS